MTDISQKIKPFIFNEIDTETGMSYSVTLEVGSYKDHIFEMRADEGFEGSGYDWSSLAEAFLEEKVSSLSDDIEFDPEGSMFCAYSSNKEALVSFITQFHAFCEDEKSMIKLFKTVELD